jgi:hypothetical protein
MKECQIKRNDYLNGGKWVGKGGINCTNPKNLNNQFAANSEDLEIEQIGIITNAAPSNFYKFKSSKLEWKLALMDSKRKCFTYYIPDDIKHECIQYVSFVSKAFDTLYVHKEGTCLAPIPGSSLRAKYADLYRTSVTHESIKLLNYDGKKCENDGEYNYDRCKQDYIYKVYYELSMMSQGKTSWKDTQGYRGLIGLFR